MLKIPVTDDTLMQSSLSGRTDLMRSFDLGTCLAAQQRLLSFASRVKTAAAGKKSRRLRLDRQIVFI